MTPSLRTMLVALAAASLPAAAPAADAPYVPTLVTDKTADDLKQELAATLKRASHWVRQQYKGHSILVYDRIQTMTAGGDEFVVGFANAQIYGPGPTTGIFDYRFAYSDLTKMTFGNDTCVPRLVALPDGMDARGFEDVVGYRLCDLLFTLAHQYQGKTEAADARFAEQAAHYRAMAVKPAVSEDMRRLIVQAEVLRDRKDYAGAAERYQRAVEFDPVAYPAAYFNLALLYEQQDLYARAIAAMRKYLALQPDAADARTAQDKIYGWEMLAGEK